MTLLQEFAPTLEAARERIASVDPAVCASSRNRIDGAATRLSPCITHGFVSLPEVLAGVASRHLLDLQHKSAFELGWREYFQHVWQHRGEGILRPLPAHAYSLNVPNDIRRARTGMPVIDQAVRTLYATGYLHNHARLFAQVDRCCASFSSWWAQSTAAKRRTISPAGTIESMPPTDMPACQ